jgi:bacillithiol system protein YtxJ
MWSTYRLGYLCVTLLVMGGVVFVAAAAEHASAGRPLNFAALLDALKSATEDDGTEQGDLSEAGAKELTKEGDYLAALVRSGSEPVLVFKHSTECSISGGAYRRTAEWLRELGEAAPAVFLVKVIEHRTISEFIAKQSGVKHESPQAILLHRGRAVWNTSHEDITAESLSAALESVTKSKDDAPANETENFELTSVAPSD